MSSLTTATSILSPLQHALWKVRRSRLPARLLDDPSYTSATMAVLIGAATLGGVAVAVGAMNALFISISLVACVFVLLDFRIGVALLIVLMPISASAVFPHAIAGITGLNPLNLLLMGTLFSCLMHRSVRKDPGPLVPSPLLWRYILPIVIAGLLGMRHVNAIPAFFQAAELINFDSAGGYIRDMVIKPLFLVLFAVLTGAAVARSQRVESFLFPFMLSTWLMSLLTIGFVLLSGASFREMASSQAREFFAPLGIHANDLGRCYAMAYALLLFTFAACESQRLRMLLLASMGLVVLALLMTFSRGAFLGFVLVNILFLISRRRIITLLAGAMVLAGLLLLLPNAVYDRIGAGWDHGLNAISAGRIDYIWLPLLPEVWSNPIIGNGIGAILWSDAMRAGNILQVTHPHNAYLRVVLDMGFLGLILVGAYFIHVWRGFRRLRSAPSLSNTSRGFYEGAAVGLVAFLLTAFAGSSLLPVYEQCFLWLAIGMMYGQQASQSENRHA